LYLHSRFLTYLSFTCPLSMLATEQVKHLRVDFATAWYFWPVVKKRNAKTGSRGRVVLRRHLVPQPKLTSLTSAPFLMNLPSHVDAHAQLPICPSLLSRRHATRRLTLLAHRLHAALPAFPLVHTHLAFILIYLFIYSCAAGSPSPSALASFVCTLDPNWHKQP